MFQISKLLFLVSCTCIIFVPVVKAAYFSVKNFTALGKPYAILVSVEAGNLTVVCAGKNVASLAAVSCASRTHCDELLPCLRNPKNESCKDVVKIGNLKPCPSQVHNSTSSTCLLHEQPIWDDSLKKRLFVDRYLCTGKDGGEVNYYYYAARYRQSYATAIAAPFKKTLELTIFKGSSALRSRSNQTLVVDVNLWPGEAVFVGCRVAKEIFQKPDKSPITARHRNGSFIEIGVVPKRNERSQFWDFSFKEFVFAPEMTGISCSAQKITPSSEHTEERRIIELNITDFENTKVLQDEIEWGKNLGCQFLDLFPPQTDVFYKIAQERGVDIARNTTVISRIGFSRVIQIAQAMDIKLKCQDTKKTTSNFTIDFFVRLENPMQPRIADPIIFINKAEPIRRDSEEIRCNFNGTPTPYVMWLQNGQILQFSWGQPKTKQTADSSSYYSTLALPPLPENSSGLSYADLYPKFSCIVSNYRGTDRRDFITGSVPKIRKRPDETFKRILFTWTKEERETILSISCHFKGSPSTFVKWMQNGLKMNDSLYNNNKDQLWESSTLHITLNLWAVVGGAIEKKYTCVVSNDFGSDTLEFQISGTEKMGWRDILLFVVAPVIFLLDVFVLTFLVAVQLYKLKRSQLSAGAAVRDGQNVNERTRLEELETFLPPASFIATPSIYPVLREMGDPMATTMKEDFPFIATQKNIKTRGK